MKNAFFLLIFISLINFIISSALDSCIIPTFLPCDESNKRSIIFSKSELCTNVTMQIPPMLNNIPCDTKCEKGFKYTYDTGSKSPKCEKCPMNTYSTGGDIVIKGSNKQWTNEFLTQRGVSSNCYLAYLMETPKANAECEGFKVESDGSLLFTGGTSKQGVKYMAELIYAVKLRHPGEIKFKYKKDSVKDISYNTGEFLFFVDYDLKVEDVEMNNAWNTFSLKLEPGEHTFSWVYNYWIDFLSVKTKYMKMQIEYIEITGVDDASYECSKCVNSVSSEGSSECYHCEANSYFANGKCEKCPEDKYSFANSIGKESCEVRPPCDVNDYSVDSVSQCRNNLRDFTFKLTEPVYCDKDNKNSLKVSFSAQECEDLTNYEDCPPGKYFNSKSSECPKCEVGKYSPKILKLLNFHSNETISEFNNTCTSTSQNICHVIKGWRFKKDQIITGKYLPDNTEIILELEKNFNINSEDSLYGEIKFDLEIEKLELHEKLEILINNKLEDLFEGKNSDQYTFRKKSFVYKLDPGVQKITWKYFKHRNQNNENNVQKKNSLAISNIVITGSDKGFRRGCVDCPKGSVKPSNQNICAACPPGMTSNSDFTQCERCPKGKYLDENKSCSDCSSFTTIGDSERDFNSCILNDVITFKEPKMRFNLFPLKEKIRRECSGKEKAHYSHTLCYNEKFISIKDRSKNKNQKSYDFFFLSVFQPDTIKVSDFDYEKDPDGETQGHIFALFQKETLKIKLSDSSYISESSDLIYENKKVLKNVGTDIKKVSLVGDGSKVSSQFNLVRNGIMIEYEEGDECLEDTARRYKSFLYLECNKLSGARYPSLETKIDNGCTLLFKWSSDYACRNCLSDELSFVTTPCKEYRQLKMFLENDNCLIFGVSNHTYTGYDLAESNKDFLLDTSSDAIIKHYINATISMKRHLTDAETENPVNVTKSPKLTDYYFVEEFSELVECNVLKGLSEKTIYILFLIPVGYILIVVLCICVYCRYRKVRNDYEKLNNKADPNQSVREENVNRQLNLE